MQSDEKDISIWHETWFLVYDLMTRNSFKHELLLTKLFFTTILCMPLGVLSIEHGFNSLSPLFFNIVGMVILFVPLSILFIMAYYVYQSGTEE